MRLASAFLGVALTACGGPDGTRDAAGDASPSCASDVDCDDALFCNGVEVCAGGRCAEGIAPCATCDEASDACDCRRVDVDGDGHAAVGCGGDDCDDGDARRHPALPEVCDVADSDEDCNPTTFGARDGDGDGYLDARCCNGASCGNDCDDADAVAHPHESETCDGIDQDCDGSVDERALQTYWLDADGDMFGLDGSTRTGCTPAGLYTAIVGGDCDDADASVNPSTTEACNGRDDDCDTDVDEELGADYFVDCDADSYGALPPRRLCIAPTGSPPGCPGGSWTTTGGDCDDTTALRSPDGTERCDGRDDDCNAVVDDPAAADAWCAANAVHTVGATCVSGACAGTCDAGYLDCDAGELGCETDGSSDFAHCGACANRCGLVCMAGACDDPVQVAAGGVHSCAVRASGAVLCWGENSSGQLGDGTVTPRLTPVPVLGLLAVEVAAGGSHTCARLADGSLRCWGHNSFGTLGDGTTTDRRTPVSVPGLSAVAGVDAGHLFTCAWLASGEVSCWGVNVDGQLGDGTMTNRSTPAPVPGLSGVAEVSTGLAHSCARRGAGTVACWGYNGFGQLGDGSSSNRASPVPVLGIADAEEVAVGGYHSCARRGSGSVLCWGQNTYGQLGDGTSTDSRTPVVVTGVTDAVEVVAGLTHTCARRAGGAVACWGRNLWGSLGDGSTLDRAVPVAVSGLGDAIEVSAGGSFALSRAGHTCALRGSGMVECWGANEAGQLGDGSTVDRSVPTSVVSP